MDGECLCRHPKTKQIFDGCHIRSLQTRKQYMILLSTDRVQLTWRKSTTNGAEIILLFVLKMTGLGHHFPSRNSLLRDRPWKGFALFECDGKVIGTVATMI
jgi:hypothetical protein